jgi:hypothetical protein
MEEEEEEVKLFADDTKIWEWIKNLADCARFQSDLDSLFAWSPDWLLRFHVGKCKTMHRGHKIQTMCTLWIRRE